MKVNTTPTNRTSSDFDVDLASVGWGGETFGAVFRHVDYYDGGPRKVVHLSMTLREAVDLHQRLGSMIDSYKRAHPRARPHLTVRDGR